MGKTMISLDYLKRQQAAERYLLDVKRAEFEKKEKRRRLKNRIILGSLVAVAAFTGSKAIASETTCLSRIIYAETAGHSIEHAIAIGQAAITKADDDEVGVCELRGVKRKQPPNAMLEYYKVLAKQLLDKPKTTVSHGATNWNQGTKPQFNGDIKRQFNNQVLYTMAVKGEK
jgi:hypothetical protein